MEIRGVKQASGVRGALTRSLSKLKVLATVGEAPGDTGPSPSSRPTETRDGLAIRWFTPRGRELRQELLYDLRHHDGTAIKEISDEVRRRGAHPDRADLRGIDLRGEDLAGANLRGADLRGATFEGCDMTHADLRGANLSGANMCEVNLNGARLESAVLAHTLLLGANLCEARLDRARLERTNLRGAELRRTRLVGATLRGLEVEQEALRHAFLREPQRETHGTHRRTRTKLGRPPQSEPRPKTERGTRGRTRSHVTRPVAPPQPREATRRLSAADYEEGSRSYGRKLIERQAAEAEGKVIPSDAFERARGQQSDPEPHGSFDEALAELITMRGQAQRIVVVVDGHARILYRNPAEARRAG